MTTIYGRDKEKSVLDAHADWLCSGIEDEGIKSIIIQGPPGIGKTALLAELYTSIYTRSKSQPNAHGLPYSPTLLDLGKTDFLSAALNPALDPEAEGASFFWFAARFDDPSYRQYRPFSFYDSLASLQGIWLERLSKTQETARSASLSIFKSALRLFPGFTALESIKAATEYGLLLIEGGQDGVEQVKNLRRREKRELDRVEDALLSASFEFPLVLVLDNAQWAFAPGAGDDGQFVESVLKKLISKDMTFVERATRLLDADIRRLLDKSALRRRRILIVMTVDSGAYSETLIHRGQPPAGPADADVAASLGGVLDALGPSKTVLGLRRLNEEQSRHVFDEAWSAISAQRPRQSTPYSDNPLVADKINAAIVESGGLPLRLREIAGLYAAGIEMDGPLESAVIHMRRLRAVLSVEEDLTSVLRFSALLAEPSNRVSTPVLTSLMTGLCGITPAVAAEQVERARSIGLFDHVGPEEEGALEFLTRESPRCIVGMDLRRANADRQRMVDFLIDKAARSISNWTWSAEMPQLLWARAFDAKRLSATEERSLSRLVVEELKRTLTVTQPTRLVNSTADTWALWAICVAEMVAAHAFDGRADLAAVLWEEHVAAIVEVLVHTRTERTRESYPAPLSQSSTKLADWHCGAWIRLLRAANQIIDTRQGIEGYARFGELAIDEAAAFKRLSMVRTIVDRICETAGNQPWVRRVEIGLEFSNHWLQTLYVVNREFQRTGRSRYLREEILTPRGSFEGCGDHALHWLMKASEDFQELRPDAQRFVKAAFPEVRAFLNALGVFQLDLGAARDRLEKYRGLLETAQPREP